MTQTLLRTPIMENGNDVSLQAMDQLVRQSRRDQGLPEDGKLRVPKGPLFSPPPDPEPETSEARAIREAETARFEKQREINDRQVRLSNLLERRGIRYATCNLKAFTIYDEKQRRVLTEVGKYIAHMKDRIANGDSVVFFGPPGTGKDHLMMAMMGHAIIKHGYDVKWINAQDFYGTVRDRMDSGGSEEQLINSMLAPQVLAISDPIPPFGGLTPFQASTLFRVIDGRYSRKLVTWMTMNASGGSDAEEKIGSAIVDRMRHGAMPLQCDWPSFRAKQPSP